MNIFILLAVGLMALLCTVTDSGAEPPGHLGDVNMPVLRKNDQAVQLMVDGSPFLIFGGELHNSSSSSLEYMKPIWPKLTTMGLNTVLAVVSWELSEPEEGVFDFSLVEGLIQQARQHDKRLVLLWFGSWKNGMSHYAPEWVKRDLDRFPRVKIEGGKHVEVITPVSDEAKNADTRAFKSFMKHLGQIDKDKHTVIMIQVQNEVGLLGDSRDRGALANDAFGKPVPKALMDCLVAHRETLLPELRAKWASTNFTTIGTWEDVFGPGPSTDELFMAWHYACYINHMAKAGKAEYALPMFVNAWIVQPEDEGPGDYPSGGPQAHLHDIWHAGAPDIDILAPDIYLPNFAEVCKAYSRSGNPLFVPESRAGVKGVANLFYAVGQNAAIGYSPFGIEDRVADPESGPITQSYRLLAKLAPLILAHQAKGTIAGVSLDQENPDQKVALGGYTLDIGIRRSRRTSNLPDLGYGLVMAVAPDEFIVVGNDIQITFQPTTPGPPTVGLAYVEEGDYVDGEWVAGRRLNGDAIMLSYHIADEAQHNRTGSVVRLLGDQPGIRHVKVYRF